MLNTHEDYCPHCGSYECILYHQGISFYMKCDGCGARGPKRKTDTEAIQGWQLRTHHEKQNP